MDHTDRTDAIDPADHTDGTDAADHTDGTLHPALSPEVFRRHGHELVDWIADYLGAVEQLPVVPHVEPGWVRSQLPPHAPQQAEDPSDVLADLDRVVLPAIAHWQHPGWYAFFPASTSPASILGELAAAGLGVQGMSWATSPAATEIEAHVLDWLVELLGLPHTWRSDGPGGGVLQMSASDSTHTALVVAREVAADRGPLESLVAYTSAQAHSSVEKGARVAGYRHLRLIDTDDRHAMSVPTLEAALLADLDAGLVPAFVCSSVGTTGTTAVDPVRAVGELARRYGLWHHVDAAYAGSAMLLPEMRHHQDGLELADSYVFNPHKWLLTNFDCSVFYVADRRPLIDTMSITPPYLRNAATDSGAVIDYRDWHVPLGRRFRALKLWFVLRMLGADGLRAHLREHVRLAGRLAERIEQHPQLELVAPVPFALVCFRHCDGDDATRELARRIDDTGRAHLTVSMLDGTAFLRVSIGSTSTTARHVDELWDLIDGFARQA